MSYERQCAETGFGLIAARNETAWRVTKDRYVRTAGITNVLTNNRVGPLPPGTPDSRGRYDTLGSTVYFADTRKTALAEVLQALRSDVMTCVKDAAAIGMSVDEYREQLDADLRARGQSVPGELSVDWEMQRSLFEVAMPADGWWVVIDSPPTLNSLSTYLGGALGQLTIAHVCGDDRSLTTQLAQIVRDSILDDGSESLGIIYPSKTGYGRCWAWWDRRGDLNLSPSHNDPTLIGSLNVAVDELNEICADWELTRTL